MMSNRKRNFVALATGAIGGLILLADKIAWLVDKVSKLVSYLTLPDDVRGYVPPLMPHWLKTMSALEIAAWLLIIGSFLSLIWINVPQVARLSRSWFPRLFGGISVLGEPGGDAAPSELMRSKAPSAAFRLGGRLYVCQINVDVRRLQADSYFKIRISCVNGTPHSMVIREIKGSIICWLPTVDNPRATELPPPQLLPLPFGSPIGPHSEFTIELDQRVPGKARDVMLDWLSRNSNVELTLSGLTIAAGLGDDRDAITKVPLWDGVVFSTSPAQVCTRRVIKGPAAQTFGTGAPPTTAGASRTPSP